MPDPTTPERLAGECTACAGDPCGCKSDVRHALNALDDLLATSTGFDLISTEDLDAVDDWANNIQLDIARHRRLRKPCIAISTFKSAMPGHSDTAHACDLGAGHEPIPHHCPRCNSEWRDPDA